MKSKVGDVVDGTDYRWHRCWRGVFLYRDSLGTVVVRTRHGVERFLDATPAKPFQRVDAGPRWMG